MFVYCGVSALGRESNRGCLRPKADLLAVQSVWGVAPSRNEDPGLFLAVLSVLKYPFLRVLATSCMWGVSCFLATLEAL